MYERSTTATTLDALPEPLRGAARERIESALLDVPAGAPAYLTRSVRTKRPGLLGRLTGSGDPDAEHHVALVLGSRDVVVAIHGDKRGSSVLSARLEDCAIEDLSRLQAAAGMDTGDGVSLNGFPSSGDAAGPASFWIGLGPPDGAAARIALTDAIRAARAA